MMRKCVRMWVWVTVYTAVGGNCCCNTRAHLTAGTDRHANTCDARNPDIDRHATHATHVTLIYEPWKKVSLIYVCKGEDTLP